MCGIAAIVRYHSEAAPIDRGELHRMREQMRPRGPDGAGEWFSADGRIGFAHRRLAIIDLNPRAAQPMVTADGGLAIVFNGEIYNYRLLRAELEAEGCLFVTSSDTEVLLHAYSRWGKGMFARLRGMYAFALWDALGSRLLLGRDPYGIKPLYYTDDGRALRLASQVKALRAGRGVARALDPAGMVGFLLTGSVPEPYTVYRAVRALPAGHALWVDERGVSEPWAHTSVADIWRRAGDEAQREEAAELAVRVHGALRDSVRHHLVADVPVGAFLSAGIDSGALVGMMRDSGQETRTVTLGFASFEGSALDESVLAARTAVHYGTQHSVRWIDDDEVERDLPAILDAMDQPSVDGVNTWLVSKAAHELGLKVVVSGVGGDELFGGYSTFTELPRWRQRLRMLQWMPGLKNLVVPMMQVLAGRGLVHPKLAGLLAVRGADYPGLYLVRRGLFMPWELPRLLDPDFVRAGLAALQPPAFVASAVEQLPADDFAAVAMLEASGYLRNQLLRDSDWASMAHSLELRTPLVDHVLLSRIAPLLVRRPVGWRAKETLANAPSLPLPPEIVGRAKTGFALPMQRWLDRSRVLDGWRRQPALMRPNVHWSRRMAYAMVTRLFEEDD